MKIDWTTILFIVLVMLALIFGVDIGTRAEHQAAIQTQKLLTNTEPLVLLAGDLSML